jgi:hypothetical protein
LATSKKVRHIKTKDIEVSIQFSGKSMKINLLLRPKLAKQLAFRLASPSRFPDPRKKRK